MTLASDVWTTGSGAGGCYKDPRQRGKERSALVERAHQCNPWLGREAKSRANRHVEF